MYKSIRPGKVWLDNNGKRIQAHGGSIIYAENKFWWYGENKEGITGKASGEPCKYWHHGVKLYSSTDLYNWVDEGFAIKESTDINNPFHPTRIMDRPHIIFNKNTKKYVMWAKTSGSDFGQCGFSICVGENLRSFVFVKEIIPYPHHAGDFDLFIKNDKAYIVYENPHKETICRELTNDYTDLSENFSSHQQAECPPFVREAPAYFNHNDKDYLLTSGTTGYYPNSTQVDDITDVDGNWKNMGTVCINDRKKNSFQSQFSSVFKHPFIENLFIAMGDRWLTDLPVNMPNINKIFYDLFSNSNSQKSKPIDLSILSDENTSEANYVWLPITFDKSGKPEIHWRTDWRIEDFLK